MMKRREFITLFAGAAATPALLWSLPLTAQQPAMPVIGFMSSRSQRASALLVTAFRKGLSEVGYVDGSNVIVEYRWAEGQFYRLPALATELVRRPVNALVATGGIGSAIAAKMATTTIPVVFAIGGDPVDLGLVTSINRPGGNLTGTTFFTAVLGAKRLELVRALMPMPALIGILANPNSPESMMLVADIEAAGRQLNQPLIVHYASSTGEIEPAFAALVEQRISALIVSADALLDTRGDQIIELAARHALPAIYQFRDYVAAGGLMSYGASIADAYRQVGDYAGRILKGAKPNDLPVLQPTKFDLIINLKTAKALGLDIPAKLLALADEVIE
jgi:putative ABC transport system substrate-binding protein